MQDGQSPERAKDGSATDGAATKFETIFKEKQIALMANTSTLTKEERKKTKRASRKKRKTDNPLKPREYARGSAKRKVKKLARGTAKR
jgi:hypothetical protein